MTIQLRPYQTAALDAVLAAWKQGRRRVIINHACGLGKTVLGLSLAARTVAKGKRCLWLAGRDELIEQPRMAAPALGIDPAKVGVVKADLDEHDRPLVLASIQTLWRTERRARAYAIPFDLVIFDECHGALAKCNRELLDALPGAPFVIGLTATVERGDGESLAPVFPGGIVHAFGLIDAVRAGWLCDFEARQVTVPEMVLDSLAHGADDDFEDGALAAALLESGVIRATADAWVEHCRDRSGLVFTAGVEQAERTAAEMRVRGINAVALSGATPLDERRAAVRALRTGEIDVICNCALFLEGTDLPEINTVVMARPTLSKGLYVQAVGRALRLAKDKTRALIIDMVGASVLHDMVTAPILVGLAHPPEGGCCFAAWSKGDGTGEPKKREWDLSTQKKTWAAWVALGNGDVMAASGPERSMVIVKPVGSGGWVCDFWRGSVRESLTPAPVWRELAVSLGEDVIRRIQGAKKVSKAGADWRAGEPSDKQRAALAKWGVAVSPGWTKGDAADALTKCFAARLLRMSS